MTKRAQLTDQQFGRWTVIGPAPMRKDRVMWLCRCVCGTERDISTGNLSGHLTKSCGCLANEANTTHGMCGTPTYRSWQSMLWRCRTASPGGKYHAALGVQVCERWHQFEKFYADMGERPEGTSLDRHPDPAGNYEPGNCRWATRIEQRHNRRQVT